MRLVTVNKLRPGDLVTMGYRSAVFIARDDHPGYPGFQLVIWRLDDGTISADALLAHQEVGKVDECTSEVRIERLLGAIGK
jgi:hypothetical protein